MCSLAFDSIHTRRLNLGILIVINVRNKILLARFDIWDAV